MDEQMFELMTKMYSELQDMKEKMVTKDEFNVLTQDVTSLKQDVTSLKQDMVRFENKVDDKLSALFDGYKQNTEQLQAIKEEVIFIGHKEYQNEKDVFSLKQKLEIIK